LRLGEIAAARPRARQTERRFVAGRLAIERALELRGRCFVPAGAERDRAEARMRGRQLRVERDCLGARKPRLIDTARLLRRFVFAPEGTAERRVRGGVLRIERDRAVQQIDGSVDVLRTLKVEQV